MFEFLIPMTAVQIGLAAAVAAKSVEEERMSEPRSIVRTDAAKEERAKP